MQGSKLYNRFTAQQSAQFGEYREAEYKLVKYLETNPTLLNKHLTYNDLLLYTSRQFNTDEDAIHRCLTYALEHIDILPLLIADFKKYNYNFENEYFVSVDIAIAIYKYLQEKDKIMDLCTKLARIYTTNKQKRHFFANLAYEVSHNGINENINLNEEVEKAFNQLRESMKKPRR